MPLSPLFDGPCYAVIFTSELAGNDEGYAETARRMMALARQQPGFLGVDSARDDIGITVSYWDSLEAIERWKQHAEHREARRRGREQWYARYRLRICKVERQYGSG